jgi:lysophospholipase L1-like esterase
MIRPTKVLAFVFSVLAVLLLLTLVFPKDGIRLGESFTLQYLTLDELFGRDSLQYADISGILTGSRAISDSAYEAMIESEPGDTRQADTLRADAESLKMLVHPIEYPGGDSTLLYPFFRRMRRLKSTGEKLRIMHYGDSQIEGDRMTSFIRYKLQNQFGGSGIGIQPAVQLYGYQMSLRHTASDGWIRYTAFGNTDSTLAHNRFGMLGSFARFSPYPDSLHPDTSVSKAWITLEQSRRTYRLTRMFRDCSIYYGNATQPVYFEVWSNGKLYDADFLEASSGLQVRSWTFDQTPEKLTFTFQSTCSPDFYGIALDNDWGLSVDNVSLRGSSGLIFSKMDEELLRQMFDILNVKLLLLQFGGNVMPYISDNYDYYEQWFTRELTTLKSLVPDLSIIVIGIADMSIKQKDRYMTYPNLENVRNALRNAAFSSDCAFWDMYSAMGGRNSMPSWVYARPPLATSDFVHFNERGARVLAEMFYNAFMHDYRSYVRSLD